MDCDDGSSLSLTKVARVRVSALARRDPDAIKVHEGERPRRGRPLALQHLALTYIRSCFVIRKPRAIFFFS